MIVYATVMFLIGNIAIVICKISAFENKDRLVGEWCESVSVWFAALAK